MKKIILLTSLLALFLTSYSNSISGKIISKVTRYGLEYAQVEISSNDTVAFTYTDLEGNFKFDKLKSGIYNLRVETVGYDPVSLYELKVTNTKPLILSIEMEDVAISLDTIVLSNYGPKIFKDPATAESPVSLRSIGIEEVERNPGSNRDISRVIRNLPGVASTPSFRNDIIIRGGSPNENRFYIDGIEVPNINHFATQGASGGPAGLINVNFVKKVDFYSGAFPANRGNTLSSVISFDFKDGRSDTTGYRVTLGASDIGLTVEGPAGSKTTYMASVRRSYLQFLFKLIDLPFLPTYNDYQFKIKVKPNDKSELTFIGLGALDQFRLNESVNDGVTDKATLRRNQYILKNLPINEQWNYTQGVKYIRYEDKYMNTFVLSRNMLNNKTFKYINNDESLGKSLDYSSQEIENKFRFEQLRYNKNFELLYTANLEYAKYNTQTNLIKIIMGQNQLFDYSSDLKLFKYGASVQGNKEFFKGKLSTSIGLRTDGNSYSQNMSNPLPQLSPRISVSYKINTRLSVSANTGIYYQLPNYTSLGYRDETGALANKSLKYIKSTHYVAGIKYLTKFNSAFSVESFLKNYDRYPFLTRDSISLANLGSGFGVVGNDPLSSTSKGKAYGLEVLYQQKLTKGFFGILAYTFVKSAFTDKTQKLKPSAWDSRNIVSCSVGKKFKNNWQVGAKFSYSGGLPYSPYDVQGSSLKSNWDIANQGQFDYNQLNTLRLKSFHALDIRVDKEFFFKKSTLDIYLDIQNIYRFAADQVPTLDVVRDTNGNPIVLNPTAPISEQRYQTELLQTGSGTSIPTFGIILDF